MFTLLPFGVFAALAVVSYRWGREGAGWPILALLPVAAIGGLSLYEHWLIGRGEWHGLDMLLSGSMGQVFFALRLVCALLAVAIAGSNRLGILFLAVALLALDPRLSEGAMSLARCAATGCQ